LTDKKIVEIGGGYGGQCQIIQTAFEVQCYEIVDLPEVWTLQKKYLSKFNVLVSKLPENPIYWEWDLCISNYALSEIKEPLQRNYVKGICKNSTNGYVTANLPIPSLNRGKRMPDIDSERKENFIITW
jgi:hypothetical protein